MQADERREFERVALPHLDAAYNLARWLTRDDHAAEEVVQEAFYRAARYFGGFRRGADGKAWLLRIVRRVGYDWLSRNRAGSTVEYREEAHDCGDRSADPELLALRAADRDRVRAALGELPPPLREAIVLRELEGLSYREIAEVAEVAVGTVMSRLARGRERLQRLLGPDPSGEAA